MTRTVTISPLTGNRFLAKEICIPESFQELTDQEVFQRGNNRRLFRIMNPKDGDKRLTWFKENLQSIQEAREMWNSLLAEGLVAYRIDESGRKGEVVEEFDPDLEEVLFAPAARALVGG